MNSLGPALSRRHFLTTIGASAASVALARLFEPGIFAEELEKRVRTPEIEEGPFYPDHLPRDTDNDLLVISDAITPAVGEVTHLSGRIVNSSGDPVRNALIEIWQVDASGSYIHSNGTNRNTNKRDANFQGYGRFLTSSTGEYYFRTIKPVPYPGRTPHIHFAIKMKGQEKWTTQCYIKGHPGNAKDGIYKSIKDPKALEAVTVDFAPIKT